MNSPDKNAIATPVLVLTDDVLQFDFYFQEAMALPIIDVGGCWLISILIISGSVTLDRIEPLGPPERGSFAVAPAALTLATVAAASSVYRPMWLRPAGCCAVAAAISMNVSL